MMTGKPSVWTIAGFDPSGGAGILSDYRTLAALEVSCFAITTAITAQNGTEFSHIQPVSAELVEAQILTLKKLGWPAVIKIGLLPNAQILRCLQHCLKDFPGSVVYDPVMISSSGTARYQLYVPSIILREVKYYNDLQMRMHAIDLRSMVKNKTIFEIEATPEEIANLLKRTTERFKETVHKGELEALAILKSRKEPEIKFCTGDKAAVKALSAIGLGALGISLEEVLGNIGQGKRLPKEAYKKANFQSLLGQGLMDKSFLVQSSL